MKNRVTSFVLALLTVFSTFTAFFALPSCKDKELEAFSGTLYSEVLPIKDGRRSVVTIIHDDGVLETAQFMKKQFEQFGLTATFAMIAGRVISADSIETADAAKWKELVKDGGFDIACHTQSHSWYGFGDSGESGIYIDRDGKEIPYSFKAGHMTDEIAGAAERLRDLFSNSSQKVCCFAVPGFPTAAGYDGRTETALEIIENSFVAARNSGGYGSFDGQKVYGLNNIDELDWHSLNSYVTLVSQEYTDWCNYVDDAVNYGGWGIFLFHAMVDEETDYQYSVAKSKAKKLFSYLYTQCEKNNVWCATFTDAALYLKEAESAEAVVSVSGDGIKVYVTDALDDDELYDMPLTVKVQVLESWSVVKIKYNGKTEIKDVLTDSDGSKYILVDITPDSGAAVITKKK